MSRNATSSLYGNLDLLVLRALQVKEEAHGLGLKVIVWTVNATDQMKALIDMGVDGIITDYPDRLRAVMRELGMPLPEATPAIISSANPNPAR